MGVCIVFYTTCTTRHLQALLRCKPIRFYSYYKSWDLCATWFLTMANSRCLSKLWKHPAKILEVKSREQLQCVLYNLHATRNTITFNLEFYGSFCSELVNSNKAFTHLLGHVFDLGSRFSSAIGHLTYR